MCKTVEPTIKVDSVSKTHGSHWALKDISFSAAIGEIIHLKGTNGAGKSTLLSILSGESVPSAGNIYLKGTKFLPSNYKLRNETYFLPEKLRPSPWMTVVEYIKFSLEMRDSQNMDNTQLAEMVATITEKWDLKPFIKRPVGTLSQGENRRLLLSIAFAADADIMLLDEPTTALDASFRDTLKNQLEAARKSKLIIISSHIEREGLPSFDRVLELESGILISDEVNA